MPFEIKKDVELGETFGKSGHSTSWAHVNYPDAAVRSNPIDSQNSNAIYKENKHGNAYLSELEVGISAVWEACVGENTPRCDLVREKVSGAYETKGVVSKKLVDWKPMNDKPEILSDEHKEKLAEILVMCYCLEEDDLHRNNIGTATINGQTQIVKIDHDMSFYQSVSSVSGNRRGYLRVNDEGRFVVTSKDITQFPDLSDANIHYWPTTYRLLEGSPGYSKNRKLRDMFIELKNDEVFINAKFAAFFKFVNITPTDVQAKIEERLGNNKPEIVSMIVNAFVVRQAEIRSNLLATQAAREYIIKQLLDA